MSAPPDVDLNSTERCDQDDQCEECGNTVTLEIVTLGTMMGVLCATLCRTCADSAEAGMMPRRFKGLVTAADRIAQHCGHLGINLDQMAAIIDAEDPNRRDPHAAGDGHPR